MNAIKLFYTYFLTIFALIFSAELLLEYRHYNLGYTTPILGVKQSQEKQDNNALINQEYGPTTAFPFKSKIISPEKSANLRLWVASSSHAEGGRTPAKDIFPNLICAAMNRANSCEAINGSGAGMLIRENIQLLKQHSEIYQPDYAILYQMSMIVSSQQKSITTTELTSSENHGIIDTNALIKWLQQTSLYVHLSDYIGGNIKLSGPLKEQLPSSMTADFEQRIISFINSCRDLGITPVLTNFSASHKLSNLSAMPHSQQTNFVKYNTYLSPTGWVKTINSYNAVLIDIAQQHKVELIDTRAVMNGQPQYFSDFIHFNNSGHATMAHIIGLHMSSILSTEHANNDI